MPPMGAMGVHYVNGNLVGTPALLLRHPEALVYAPARGHLRLAALEYIVLKSTWDNAHGNNAPRPRLYGHRFNITPAPNRYGLPVFSLTARLDLEAQPGRHVRPCGTPPSTAPCRHPARANPGCRAS